MGTKWMYVPYILQNVNYKSPTEWTESQSDTDPEI